MAAERLKDETLMPLSWKAGLLCHECVSSTVERSTSCGTLVARLGMSVVFVGASHSYFCPVLVPTPRADKLA